MRCISYHVAFGCIHCIRDALHIFRNAYECITHAYTCIHTVHCMHFQTALQHTTAYGYIRCAAYDCIRKGVLHTLHTRRIQRFQKCSVCVSYAVYAAECNMVRNAAHHGKKVYLFQLNPPHRAPNKPLRPHSQMRLPRTGRSAPCER